MSIHVLSRTQVVAASLEVCWRFFSDPHNLAELTPPELHLRPIGEVPAEARAGLLIRYRVRPLLGIPMTWISEITDVQPPRSFVDDQRAGPYRLWHHEHTFAPRGAAHTEISDVVHYALPFGFLGDLVHALVVRRQLQRIFDFRAAAVDRIFAETDAASA